MSHLFKSWKATSDISGILARRYFEKCTGYFWAPFQFVSKLCSLSAQNEKFFQQMLDSKIWHWLYIFDDFHCWMFSKKVCISVLIHLHFKQYIFSKSVYINCPAWPVVYKNGQKFLQGSQGNGLSWHLKSYLHSWGPIIYILPKFLPSAMFPY